MDRRVKRYRSSSGSSALLPLLFASALGLPSVAVGAEDPETVRLRNFREQYERAGRAYRDQDYAAAIPLLRAAYALEPAPQILFNIGQAHRKLEQFGEARAYFELYRALAPALTTQMTTQLDELVIEMREKEKTAREPQVVEKTKLLYVQQEKPLPKWLMPAGIGVGVAGLLGIGAGAGLLAVHGRCANSPIPPMLECTTVYNTDIAGKVLTVAGSVMLVGGVVMFGLSFKKPARPAVVREMANPPPVEELPSVQVLLPIARPDAEPPPAGWNSDGTKIHKKP